MKRVPSSARSAWYLARGDGTSLGHWIRRCFTLEQRRRLALTVLAGDDVVFEFDRNGTRWAVPAGGDPVSTGLFVHGQWAGHDEVDPTLAWLEHNTGRRGNTVVEVGANIGSSTIPLASHDLHVIAIEPVPQTCAFLERNLVANGWNERVEVVCAAIAPTTPVQMQVEAWHATSRVVEAPAAATIQVPAVSLTELVASRRVALDEIRFVWCDAEGSEDGVIATGASLWASGVPLFAEFGHVDLGAIAALHFSGFVLGSEIRRDGAAARVRPIGELTAGFTEMVMYVP